LNGSRKPPLSYHEKSMIHRRRGTREEEITMKHSTTGN
jgi:hypothetical protein